MKRRHNSQDVVGSARSGELRQQGLAVVEFALVASLLFLLLFSIIDFGLLFYNRMVILNAARTGVRAASIKAGVTSCSNTQANTPCQLAYSQASGSLLNDADLSVTLVSTGSSRGDLQIMIVQYSPRSVFTKILGSAALNEMSSADARMYHE